MVNIYLVRHGEAAHSWANSTDSELSSYGHQQALSVVEYFKDHEPLKICSSPLLRARETAAPLATKWGEPIFIETRFKEIPTEVQQKDRQKWLQGFDTNRLLITFHMKSKSVCYISRLSINFGFIGFPLLRNKVVRIWRRYN